MGGSKFKEKIMYEGPKKKKKDRAMIYRMHMTDIT